MEVNGSFLTNNASPYVNKLAASGGENRAIDSSNQEGGGLKKVSKDELKKEMDSLNKWMQSGETHLKFTLHEKLNEYYVQIVNDQTNEIIREIPSKKMMDMVAKMHEMIGLLVDEKR